MEVYFSDADTAAAALMLAATAFEVKVPKNQRHAKVGVAHHPVCHLANGALASRIPGKLC